MTFTSEWISVPHKYGYLCPACKSRNLEHRTWESSCGGFEDIKYRCKECHNIWWVDGIDS